MALDGADRERLDRIEHELMAADPAFAARLRRWEPHTGPVGWSVAPPWMLLVFVVAFLTWVGTPALAVIAAVVGGAWLVGRHRRPRTRPRPAARR